MSWAPQACTVIASTGEVTIAALRGCEITGAPSFSQVQLPSFPHAACPELTLSYLFAQKKHSEYFQIQPFISAESVRKGCLRMCSCLKRHSGIETNSVERLERSGKISSL